MSINISLPRKSRRWLRDGGLITILVVFSAIVLAQSITLPLFESSDEQHHYAYARYLATKLALPPRHQVDNSYYYTYGVAQEAGQPPLYYIPVAILTTFVTEADNTSPYVEYNNFIRQLGDASALHDNVNLYLHGIESDFPFQGVALAVHLGRLVSLVIGFCTLLTVYGIGRALVPAQPATALLATLLVSSVPGFIFVHSVITNDTAVILFVSLTIWIAVRIAREGVSTRLALLGGLFGGLATLSKVNGIWAGGIVWLAILLSAVIHRRKQPIRSSIPAVVLSIGIWLLLTGWWFVLGMIQSGDALGIAIHAFKANQNPFDLSALHLSPLEDLARWDVTTWYSSGWNRIFGPEWIYQLYRYLYLLGLLGTAGWCIYQAIKLHTLRRASDASASHVLQVGCLILAMCLAVAGGLYWEAAYGWRLGRLIYPGLTSVALLAAIGWSWWSAQLKRLHLPLFILPGTVVTLTVLLLSVAIWTTINTYLALHPHLLVKSSSPEIVPTNLTFVDDTDHRTPVAAVTGYRILAPQNLRSGDVMNAEVCWKSMGYVKRNFPYSLQLVGPYDTRIGTRNSYHGLGSYPIKAWKPGEEFCDFTSIQIDNGVDKLRAYKLIVSLFQLKSEPSATLPLTSLDSAGREVYSMVGRVRVAPEKMPVVTSTIDLGDVAGLVSTQIDMQPDNTLSVTLRWSALNSTGVNAKVFMHVADKETGKIIAQDDHEPDNGWFPTSYWLKGDVIDDHFIIPLPVGISLDKVTMHIGMYDAQTLNRLPAVNVESGRRYQDDVVTISP